MAAQEERWGSTEDLGETGMQWGSGLQGKIKVGSPVPYSRILGFCGKAHGKSLENGLWRGACAHGSVGRSLWLWGEG